MTVEIPPLPDFCWPVDWSCAQDIYDELQTTPEGVAATYRAEALATSALRMLTNYKVGGCPITVRPCTPRCVPDSYLTAPIAWGGNWAGGGNPGLGFAPFVYNGKWFNACGCMRRDCSCTSLSTILLPGPVAYISEITIDGAVLDPSAYRVDNGNELIRLDGDSWPACQDMNAPLEGEGSDVGTLGVTYLRGIAPDGLAAAAAGRLAVEFAKACMGANCQLPTGVTQITRQGITMTIPTGAFPDGLTGIREVDVFIAFWNPFATKVEAEIFSPQRSRTRQTTWSTP